MNSFIILLRGIMPMGKNKVPMATLKTVLTDHGFQKVHTYIQTGNILLQSKLTKEKVKAQVATLIKDEMGADIKVFVLEKAEVQTMLAENPFTVEDPSRIFYTFLSEIPARDKKDTLLKEDFSPEKLVIEKNRAYMFIPGSAARSNLSNNFLENKLRISATTRNANTLNKLLLLFEQHMG